MLLVMIAFIAKMKFIMAGKKRNVALVTPRRISDMENHPHINLSFLVLSSHLTSFFHKSQTL